MSSDLVNNNSAWERQVLEAGKRRAVEQAVAQARQEERERIVRECVEPLREYLRGVIRNQKYFDGDKWQHPYRERVDTLLVAVEAKLKE